MANYNPCPAAMSKLARLAMSAPGTDSPITQWFTFRSFNTGTTEELIDLGRDTTQGSRSHAVQNSRDNLRRLAPTMSLKPTAIQWGNLLPWIFCGLQTGTGPYTFALGEREVARKISYDDTQTVWEFDRVVVDEATISASQGGELGLELSCVGRDWTTGNAFPASGLVADLTTPFIMSDLSVSVGATSAVKCRDFRLTVRNVISRERFFNSRTIACAVATDREVSLSMSMPYGLHQALYRAGAGPAGVAVSGTFTFGAASLAFNMPHVKTPGNPFSASVPDEIMMDWTGTAMATLPGNELSASLTLAP